MILAREDMIWIAEASGKRTPFDATRLVASIIRSLGPHASLDEMTTVAESVAVAIYQHVRDHGLTASIAVEEVGDMVEALLEMLGYDECAVRYGIQLRQADVCLDELALRGGDSFELGFYRELDATLEVAGRRPMSRLQMRGLRACVMRLRGTQRWGASCKKLAEEILDHVWARLERMEWGHTNGLQLAVIE